VARTADASDPITDTHLRYNNKNLRTNYAGMGVIRGKNRDSTAKRHENRVDRDGGSDGSRVRRPDSGARIDNPARSVAGRGTVGVARGVDSELIPDIGDERFISPHSIENTGK